VNDALTVEKAVSKTLQSRTGTRSRALSSEGQPRALSGGGGGGDPITHFNGKSIQFWLPLDTNVKMISMDGFELFGMAREVTSLKSMQWFSDLTLNHKGQEILHVGTQNVLKHGGLAALEAVAPPAKLGAGLPLRFLDVTTVDGDKRQQASITGTYFLSQGLVIADISHDEQYMVYKLNKEHVKIFESENPESVVFEFHAAKANKFTDKLKQLKHLHLDMEFGDLATKSITGGILPQIWGIQARTSEVEQMLHRPY
jgi:hypothetical protein